MKQRNLHITGLGIVTIKSFALFILLMLNNIAFAQTVKISGKVTDKNNGAPIAGANVVIKGTTNGSITDLDGNYIVEVAPNATLVFSFIGYATVEIPVQGQTVINITLIEEAQTISDVVVVGYGTQKKSDLTGAVLTVSNDKIKNLPTMSLDQALQGKAAGVEITSSSGQPGTDVMIRIRGTGTINNSDPIFVVDGLIISPDAVKYLNSADMESISVLKDASASAIYGARGANGVVMITTKKGKSGKITVNVGSYYGVQKVAKWMDMLDGKEYATVQNNIKVLQGGALLYNPDTVASTNWFNAVSRTAIVKNYDFSVSGGSEKSVFLLSTSYHDADGIIKNSFYKRFTVRLNSDFKVNDWLTVGENVQFANSSYRMINEADAYNRFLGRPLAFNPITPIYLPDGTYARSVIESGKDAGNPLAHLDLNNPNNTDSRILGSGYTEIAFLKNLKLRSSIGFDYGFYEFDQFTPVYIFNMTDFNSQSKLDKNVNKTFAWQLVNTLTYNKTIGNHDITAMAGIESSEYKQSDVKVNSSDSLPNEDATLRYLNYFVTDPNNVLKVFGGADHSTLYSYFGRVNYGFMDKYLLTATIRRDGSSKFGSANKFGLFPSFGLAWKISNESFLKSISQISSLKLRAGWGRIGNEKISSGQTFAGVSSGLAYSFNDQPFEGKSTLTPPNKSLKWETTEQTNIGLDGSLFNNKLEITADYFIRNTLDMLCQISVPDVTGIRFPPVQNIGKVNNKGWEITANYRSQFGKLTYGLGGSISHARNEVKDLGQPGKFYTYGSYGQGFGPLSRTEAGHPIASFYGYKVDGIFKTYEEIRQHAAQFKKTSLGDFKFKDLNGDGVINSNDQTYIGSPFPFLTYGLNFDFSYIGFDLRFSFQGVYGVDILTPYKYWTMDNSGEGRNLESAILDSWTPSNPGSNVPRLDPTANNNNYGLMSSYYLEDGSYLRLKDLQFGYTIPNYLVKKVGIERCKFFVSGQNLLTFTKYTGNDPEVGLSQGSGNQLIINVDYVNVPQPRKFTLGFELSF